MERKVERDGEREKREKTEKVVIGKCRTCCNQF